MKINFKESNTANFSRGRSQKVKYLVIHYTSNNGDTAKNNADYFAREDVGASAHYFCDVKARYLAKEYMEEEKISTPEEIKKMVQGFDKINYIGIKVINYKFFLNIMIKVLIFSLICILR